MSLVVAESSTMEVSAPMAAFFITTGCSGFFSSKFAPLLLNQGLNFLQQVDIDSVMTFDDDTGLAIFQNAYTDYLYRPVELQYVSWFAFVSYFEKKGKGKEKPKPSVRRLHHSSFPINKF